MVKRPRERSSDRFVSIGLSVLVHAAIVGALFWGWLQYRHAAKPPPTLAIEGTVVRHAPPQQRSPAATHPAPIPTPPTPPPVDQTKLAQEAQQRASEKLAAQKAADEKLAEQKAADQKAADEAAHARVAQEEADKAAAARAEAARQEAKRKADEAEKQARLAAERKAKEEAELKAKQEAARAAQLKEQQAEQQRETDLRSQLQAEEHLDALQRGPAEAEYINLIAARISRAWVRPPGWQPGLKCIIHITQIPGGDITNVTVESCGGDEAARQSVQTAAYRASPLPAPPDPALFNPNITVTFAPDE